MIALIIVQQYTEPSNAMAYHMHLAEGTTRPGHQTDMDAIQQAQSHYSSTSHIFLLLLRCGKSYRVTSPKASVRKAL